MPVPIKYTSVVPHEPHRKAYAYAPASERDEPWLAQRHVVVDARPLVHVQPSLAVTLALDRWMIPPDKPRSTARQHAPRTKRTDHARLARSIIPPLLQPNPLAYPRSKHRLVRVLNDQQPALERVRMRTRRNAWFAPRIERVERDPMLIERIQERPAPRELGQRG